MYFDITHAFRTLPIFELLVMRYLNEVQQKKANIVMVSYGMFDAQRDGVTPIVDIKRLLGIMDHLNAASEYQRFGTLYTLLDLQETGAEHDDFNDLRNMSEWTSINNINALKRFIGKAHGKANNPDPAPSETDLLLQQVYLDIAKHFPDQDDDMLLSLSLARWHFDKRRYLHALIVPQESLITFALSVCGEKNIDEYRVRQDYRERLHGLGRRHDLGMIFYKLSKLRNQIVHGSLNHQANDSITIKIDGILKELKTIYETKYKDKRQQEALSRLLQ